MTFRKLLIGLTMSGLAAVAPIQAYAQEPASDVAKDIVKEAKKKLIIKGLTFLGKQLFGADKASYVNLSEESLRKIQMRVRAEIIRDAEFDFLAQFHSLEDLVEAYHVHVNHTNVPNISMQQNLLGRATDARNHRALNPNNNVDYFYMADTFALLASVTVAVETERFLSGQIPKAEVARVGSHLADTLEDMVQKKRAADLPLRDDCEMVSSPFDQYEEWECWVKDANGYVLAWDRFDGDRDWGWDNWDIEREQAVQKYMDENFYSLDEVVMELRAL